MTQRQMREKRQGPDPRCWTIKTRSGWWSGRRVAVARASPGWAPIVDTGEVRLFSQWNNIFVSTPGGVAVLRGGKLQPIPLPLGTGIPSFTPLGRWLGLTTGWGTVVLDEAGKVKYQAKGAGRPAPSGPYVLLPIEGQLTLFPGPK